jgi:hypothetical protein
VRETALDLRRPADGDHFDIVGTPQIDARQVPSDESLPAGY